ncbi:MAG: hypothetical protein AB1757_06200 [Acidobacteriota bacterium]
MYSSIKRAKLLALIFMLAMAVALSLNLKTGIAQQKTEIVGVGTTLDQRLGADDKPSLVIHFTGELHGNLEPCG